MLHHIVAALGHTPRFYTATLTPQAAAALAAEHAERGRTPIVIFDEAHLLDNTQLEAIRMLTNHNMDSGAPFAAILIGQPTLRQRLRLGVLAALDQRVTVRYAHPLKLLADLRAMGETSVLAERHPKPLTRQVLARAFAIYVERFAEPDGRVPATFEILTLTGWAPDPSQQKPLKPGSAKMRLADALGVVENPLPRDDD